MHLPQSQNPAPEWTGRKDFQAAECRPKYHHTSENSSFTTYIINRLQRLRKLYICRVAANIPNYIKSFCILG